MEPLVVLALSYTLLGNKINTKLFIVILQICLGVSFTIAGAIETSTYGLITLFFGIFATASRSVFYKMSFDKDESVDSYSIYLNTNFLSFILFCPFYMLKVALSAYYDKTNIVSIHLEVFDIGKCLLIGTFFNFLYNLVSILVLSNLTTLTHSVINVAKRMFVVFSSSIFFAAYLTQLQLTGLILADSGLLIYTWIRIKTKNASAQVVPVTKDIVKKLIIGVLVLIFIGSFVSEALSPGMNKFKKIDTSKSSLEYKDLRLVCIDKIRNRILQTYEDIIPKENQVILVSVPLHINYGDTMIWYLFFLYIYLEIYLKLVHY